ncbi:MAG: hypothetical protein PF484_03695 [Bacteroidales bacterium]|nr:hypothetical protein [Bacteroidales bacterium]
MKQPKTSHKGFLFTSNKTFALAASVTILLLVAIFALLEFPSIEAKPQLSEELLHVKMYYSSQTDDKMTEIRNCATETSNKDMLFETADNRLHKLDNNTLELEQKLAKAHGNKQLKNAYIQSLKAKSEIVNQIYAQLCVENTNSIITQ